MKIIFLRHFYKDLDKLRLRKVKDDVLLVIKNVEDAKSISEIKNLKKLSGHKHAFRIKIGNYRIGVFIEKNIVEFARIAHRKDVYNLFP